MRRYDANVFAAQGTNARHLDRRRLLGFGRTPWTLATRDRRCLVLELRLIAQPACDRRSCRVMPLQRDASPPTTLR